MGKCSDDTRHEGRFTRDLMFKVTYIFIYVLTLPYKVKQGWGCFVTTYAWGSCSLRDCLIFVGMRARHISPIPFSHKSVGSVLLIKIWTGHPDFYFHFLILQVDISCVWMILTLFYTARELLKDDMGCDEDKSTKFLNDVKILSKYLQVIETWISMEEKILKDHKRKQKFKSSVNTVRNGQNLSENQPVNRLCHQSKIVFSLFQKKKKS